MERQSLSDVPRPSYFWPAGPFPRPARPAFLPLFIFFWLFRLGNFDISVPPSCVSILFQELRGLFQIFFFFFFLSVLVCVSTGRALLFRGIRRWSLDRCCSDLCVDCKSPQCQWHEQSSNTTHEASCQLINLISIKLYEVSTLHSGRKLFRRCCQVFQLWPSRKMRMKVRDTCNTSKKLKQGIWVEGNSAARGATFRVSFNQIVLCGNPGTWIVLSVSTRVKSGSKCQAVANV